MADKILNMIFRASDQATGTINKIKGSSDGGFGIAGLTGALSGLINPATLALGALSGIAAVVSKSVSDYDDFAIATGRLQDSLNLTAHDASYLQNVIDHFNVSNDTMVAVFRTMNREGLAPTVVNLQAVMEHYDSLSDGAEKMMYAQKMLGEQGIKQLIPWWENLTEAEKEHLGVQIDGIELTQEQIDKEKELTKTIEIRKQAQQSALKDLGADTVDARLEWNKFWADFWSGGQAISYANENLYGFSETVQIATLNIESAAQGTEKYIEFLKKEHSAVSNVDDALTDMSATQLESAAYEAYLAGDYALADKYFTEAQAIRDKTAALREWIEAMKEETRWNGGWPGLAPHGSTPGGAGAGTGSGNVQLNGQTFNDAHWQGDTLIVRGQVYGTFPGQGPSGGGGGKGNYSIPKPDLTPVHSGGGGGSSRDSGGGDVYGSSLLTSALENLGKQTAKIPQTIVDQLERKLGV